MKSNQIRFIATTAILFSTFLLLMFNNVVECKSTIRFEISKLLKEQEEKEAVLHEPKYEMNEQDILKQVLLSRHKRYSGDPDNNKVDQIVPSGDNYLYSSTTKWFCLGFFGVIFLGLWCCCVSRQESSHGWLYAKEYKRAKNMLNKEWEYLKEQQEEAKNPGVGT